MSHSVIVCPTWTDRQLDSYWFDNHSKNATTARELQGTGMMLRSVYIYGYRRDGSGVGFGPWYAGAYMPTQQDVAPIFRGYHQ